MLKPIDFIDNPKIIRPANYPEGVPGKGYNIYEKNGKNIAVINLIGRVDIAVLSENPFLKVKSIIDEIANNPKYNENQIKEISIC
jgi:calcineurin-like phosphoesterase